MLDVCAAASFAAPPSSLASSSSSAGAGAAATAVGPVVSPSSMVMLGFFSRMSSVVSRSITHSFHIATGMCDDMDGVTSNRALMTCMRHSTVCAGVVATAAMNLSWSTSSTRSVPFLPRDRITSRSFASTISYVISSGGTSNRRFFLSSLPFVSSSPIAASSVICSSSSSDSSSSSSVSHTGFSRNRFTASSLSGSRLCFLIFCLMLLNALALVDDSFLRSSLSANASST
mmetsp:Transcript_8138/g.21507  ORF Transcript_8138/g.21507 Transcript_8138/m.21507 type:complete len:230 (+) Transcript_8138:1352-2041(+)